MRSVISLSIFITPLTTLDPTVLELKELEAECSASAEFSFVIVR
jgi:hypothetical protein